VVWIVQNRVGMKRVLTAAGLSLLLGASGCFPGYYGRANLVGALWTAAVIGLAVHIAVHDAHYHGENCGHYHQWHDGRWVYWYNDHWEYYDPATGQWYMYE
jgi:hypothetical protein